MKPNLLNLLKEKYFVEVVQSRIRKGPKLKPTEINVFLYDISAQSADMYTFIAELIIDEKHAEGRVIPHAIYKQQCNTTKELKFNLDNFEEVITNYLSILMYNPAYFYPEFVSGYAEVRIIKDFFKNLGFTNKYINGDEIWEYDRISVCGFSSKIFKTKGIYLQVNNNTYFICDFKDNIFEVLDNIATSIILHASFKFVGYCNIIKKIENPKLTNPMKKIDLIGGTFVTTDVLDESISKLELTLAQLKNYRDNGRNR